MNSGDWPLTLPALAALKRLFASHSSGGACIGGHCKVGEALGDHLLLCVAFRRIS